jgi:hypothetical protein
VQYNFFLEKSINCYERRPRCFSSIGWCYTSVQNKDMPSSWGFCSEKNELPDAPADAHPLFEVPTFPFPKEVN